MNQPAQQQNPPGTEQQMRPTPDHGEASYRGSGRLAGKTAVVTGADSGIGKADTRKWGEDAGRAAVLVPGDLTDAAHCRAVIDRAVQEFGRVDILISNAAFQATHGRRAAHASGRVDHRHHLSELRNAYPSAPALRRHQGRRWISPQPATEPV